MSKPRIVHMVEGFDQVGGPPALVRLLLASPLAERYSFQVLDYLISGLNPKAIAKLRRRLLDAQPDLVHVHGLKADGFHAVLAARLAKVPRILVAVHGSTADALADYEGATMKLRRLVVGQLLEPVTLRLADAVYCVCDAMKNRSRIRRHAGTRLRGTIHNGISADQQRCSTVALRESFGFTQTDTVMIYTGRISRDKGLEVLAAALREVLDAADAPKRLKVLLVGDGPDFAELNTLFQPLIHSGHVVMAGRRADISVLNAMADVFVFPSFHENLSFSLLEAMSACLPVVATNVGGNPEVVVDGQTGLLVPPYDVGSLAKAMLKLAEDPGLRAQLGQAGRVRLLRHFSCEATTSKTGALYEALLRVA